MKKKRQIRFCKNLMFLNVILLTHFSGKGGKNRRRGKNENEAEKRELIFKEEGQEYAQVSFNACFMLICVDIQRMPNCGIAGDPDQYCKTRFYS